MYCWQLNYTMHYYRKVGLTQMAVMAVMLYILSVNYPIPTGI
jgi:hypothetical protein